MEAEDNSVNPEIQNVLFAIVIILEPLDWMVNAMRPEPGCVPFDERIGQQFFPFLSLDGSIQKVQGCKRTEKSSRE